MEQTFYDIHSTATVFGVIMKDTSILKNPEVNLSVEDFILRPHKILFSTIQNLCIESEKKFIDEIDVDAYLSAFPVQHQVFKESNLGAYINYAKEIADMDNFTYCYNNIKKLSLIRDFNDIGVDTSDIYAESKLDASYEDKALKFSKMTIKDIIEHYSSKYTALKMKWNTKSESTYQVDMKNSVDEYLDNLSKTPDIGTSMQSKLLTAIVRGNRKKNIYVSSGGSGAGKTRYLLAEAVGLASDEIYDLEENKWVKNGIRHNVLFISTEVEDFERIPMALAFLSGCEETNIKNQTLNDDEKERVMYAAKILKEINFQIFYISDYCSSDIADVIDLNITNHSVDHIYFDYVQLTPRAFSHARDTYGVNLREDQILTYMLSELKEICNAKDIFLHTATQLNRSSTEKDTKLGANTLRGSFGMSDKISYGAIRVRMSSKDYEDIEDILRNGLYPKPDTKSYIFKNRGSKLKNVIVYTAFNLGTLREKDCFVTDEDGKLIEVAPLQINYKTEEVVEENTNVFTSSNIEF